MRMRENIFDRVAYKGRPLIFGLAILALPVFLVSYFYMFSLLRDAQSVWIFVVVGISHAIVWLGASCLHDFQQERR